MNIFVAWKLVIKRHINKRLIVMMHGKHLCELPQVRKGDSFSLL